MAFLNYHHLRYCWATVKEGGVTRASRKLNVSQPTVSSQIRELEDVFEQPLLDRDTQKLVLTEAGQICYRYAPSYLLDGTSRLLLSSEGSVASAAVA